MLSLDVALFRAVLKPPLAPELAVTARTLHERSGQTAEALACFECRLVRPAAAPCECARLMPKPSARGFSP